ncbi:DUF6479 family protein [Streptomyces sp. NPDC048479]|uniref:DUF6479 family protein n=1 Tax=Streptomyces sp. NPDC048479 TaxID=3154725 RepID=UPI0034388104
MVTFSHPAGDGLTEFGAGTGALAGVSFVLVALALALLVLLVGLVWWWGARSRRDPPPRPDEQPRRPVHRAHVESRREPDEFAEGGVRLAPHELRGYGNMGSRPVPPERPHDSGGPFGSGGLGG